MLRLDQLKQSASLPSTAAVSIYAHPCPLYVTILCTGPCSSCLGHLRLECQLPFLMSQPWLDALWHLERCLLCRCLLAVSSALLRRSFRSIRWYNSSEPVVCKVLRAPAHCGLFPRATRRDVQPSTCKPARHLA